MKVLHICSYYIGNKLYGNLINSLSQKGIVQHIFIPIREQKNVGKNILDSNGIRKVSFYYERILKRYHKFFFFTKIKKQYRVIENEILENTEIDFIHAHTLFSDGGTAYKLNRKYGTPYIVTIRNTDINVFFKYGLHLRPFIYKVLLNAKEIIFISYSYKTQLLSKLPLKIGSEIESKCKVIPNGIDEQWRKSVPVKKKSIFNMEISLLFIGEINKNKNLQAVLLTCSELIKEGYHITLHVIGNGPLLSKHKHLAEKMNIIGRVHFYGYVRDRERIKEIMNSCDVFVMPSYKETFGLVYVEAMSRGLPVVYSQNQGFDGFFQEGEVGYSTDPNSVEMIKENIKKIALNLEEMSNNCIAGSEKFNWDCISDLYLNLYLYQ